jgi:hypothetical protein
METFFNENEVKRKTGVSCQVIQFDEFVKKIGVGGSITVHFL